MFNSDYIVKLLDVYQSQTFFYLVMELCGGGDLFKMLKLSPGNLPIDFVSSVICQVAKGISEIHDKCLIHRDLKTANIFIYQFPQN
jgi:serine/threonine protein kinase